MSFRIKALAQGTSHQVGHHFFGTCHIQSGSFLVLLKMPCLFAHAWLGCLQILMEAWVARACMQASTQLAWSFSPRNPNLKAPLVLLRLALQSDPTYLIISEQATIMDYGLNSVCTHLGCVVPWNVVRLGPHNP